MLIVVLIIIIMMINMIIDSNDNHSSNLCPSKRQGRQAAKESYIALAFLRKAVRRESSVSLLEVELAGAVIARNRGVGTTSRLPLSNKRTSPCQNNKRPHRPPKGDPKRGIRPTHHLQSHCLSHFSVTST